MLREFLDHVVLGTLLFLLVYVPAVALNVLVHWLCDAGYVDGVIVAVQFAEWALVIADTTLFVVFLAKATWRAANAL